jgi:hypothetical protein
MTRMRTNKGCIGGDIKKIIRPEIDQAGLFQDSVSIFALGNVPPD